MAVNLSDIAAMGGAPGHALVSVVGARPKQLRSLYEGILEAAASYHCPVVGGDLSAGSELVVSVAITGWVNGAPVLRSGARPGDTIWVTGALGAASAGLRLLKEAGPPGPAGPHHWSEPESDLVRAHTRPRPALAEGALARASGATAMIDVSDGLVADLSRVAELSGVGFELLDVPVAAGATLAEALGGGDDYVLAFTMAGTPPGRSPRPAGPGDGAAHPAPSSPRPRVPVPSPSPSSSGVPAQAGGGIAEAFAIAGLAPPYLIGTCLPDPARRLMAGRPVQAPGWDHSL
jgi:thiamine-monophosphate kinase